MTKTAECVECGGSVPTPGDVEIGATVDRPTGGAEPEVVGVEPTVRGVAPAPVEDGGV